MSNGMETYVQKKIVKDESSLSEFLQQYLHALSYSEIGFAAHAASGEDITLLDHLCGASRSPRELREGSMKLYSRFQKALKYMGDYPALEEYWRTIKESSCDGHYCIAVGLLIQDLKVDIREGLQLFAYNQISSMVNHAVKLIPLRQLEGQRALKQAAEVIPKVVNHAMNCKLELLGVTGPGFDFRSMEHEYLEARMYLS